MTAHSFQPSAPRRSSAPRRRSRPKIAFRPEHQWVVAEIFLKLGLNSILLVAAIAALVRLLPYHQVQQAKLDQVKMQVQETEQRVAELRKDFNRSFDPRQARKIMEEQTPRIAPNQRRIVLTTPGQ
ncbi:MAG: hypothetical protein ACRC6M_12195 [Microcystaceae cyanobacterium]